MLPSDVGFDWNHRHDDALRRIGTAGSRHYDVTRSERGARGDVERVWIDEEQHRLFIATQQRDGGSEAVQWAVRTAVDLIDVTSVTPARRRVATWLGGAGRCVEIRWKPHESEKLWLTHVNEQTAFVSEANAWIHRRDELLAEAAATRQEFWGASERLDFHFDDARKMLEMVNPGVVRRWQEHVRKLAEDGRLSEQVAAVAEPDRSYFLMAYVHGFTDSCHRYFMPFNEPRADSRMPDDGEYY